MNIWLLQASEPMPVVNEGERLLKMGMIAQELAKRGHNVTWFSNSFDHFHKKQLCDKDKIIEVADNYAIYLFHAIGYKKNISVSRIINHKMIAMKFKKEACKLEKPDLIYASFPIIDYPEEAVKYGKKSNVPVIVDIRDLWPDIFYHNLPKYLSFIATPYIQWMNHKTKKIFRDAFAINGNTEAILQWGLDKAKREKGEFDRYFHIGYDKPKSSKNNLSAERKKELIDEGKFNITFAGTINNQFDYEKIIELGDYLQKKDKDIVINICGQGPQMEMLKKMAENSSNIKLLGWLGKEELRYILQHSQTGLAPYKNTFDFQMNVTNKFAEYISYGLPIVLTLDGEMKKLAKDNQCGLATIDIEKIGNFIMQLKNNPEEYQKMSDKAKNLYEKEFVAERIYQELVDYLEKIKEEKV